jgi:hypothetical protein
VISAPSSKRFWVRTPPGLSPTTIARLTAGREKEYADFRQRHLSGRERQLNGAVLLLLARTVVKLDGIQKRARNATQSSDNAPREPPDHAGADPRH